ncbi:RNA 2',3'-cyclic phosphodiesterase [Lysobacter sp. Root983]|uniref:RNA 2',3'-cyclic phosphodiesterase n=1 Tax=Lysobacter sp. Root983 TaxID=1736613 RepID=UPI000710F4E7|nr:RNA 2',3'-cyclic phosphodiesterase [Lysobacter sp. Root983]KRD79462.1 hypothetical protein ASE43_00615 [Lysobacter sp. Root983]
MQQDSLFGPAPAARSDIHRLFFALMPDTATRERIAGLAPALRQRYQGGGRLIGAHRYHLTLQFLGDFGALPQAIAERAATAAQTLRLPAFELSLDRAGSFRNHAIPWWLGCEHPAPGLTELWERLGVALAKAGVRIESGHRAHAPHVTILRDAERALAPTPIEPIAWRVDRFVLVHSLLAAQGQSRYDILGEWPLADA